MNDLKDKIKIIFVDIDWTILNHKIHDWDYESINYLKGLQSQGILIYLCTARPYDSVVHTGLLEFFTPDGIISTNGGVAFVGNEVLYSNEIPQDVVKKTEDIANAHNLVVEMSTDRGRYFSKDKNKYVDEYFKYYAETVPPTVSGVYENVSAMLLFAPEEMDEFLIKELPQQLRYYRFDAHGVDLCYFENDKGKAISRVLKHLNLKKEESIGIGDDYGDLAMFAAVGISIAMGNGKDEVKEKATYVAPSISDNGIAKMLKILKL